MAARAVRRIKIVNHSEVPQKYSFVASCNRYIICVPCLHPYNHMRIVPGQKDVYLWCASSFDCLYDVPKDPEEHKLITKTEAITAYLLKDCDLEKREPSLRFIRKKNPHNVRWGEMKLYLRIQVEERALEVWGTPERIEEERERREEKRVMSKSKKYHKQLKKLRMEMRSSLYDRTSKASHTHEFGSEKYIEEEDNYTRKCKTCPYEETYEKM